MCVSDFQNKNKPVKTLTNKSLLSLNPSENLKILVNQFNNASQEDNIDPKNATHE